jgi:hypothetical protein
VFGRVRLAAEWIRQPVQVETDCLGLAKAVQVGGGDRARWGGIISEIIRSSNILPACKFDYVRREANEVVHRLARRGLQMKEWVVMRFDVPDNVRSVVLAETARAVNSPNLCNPCSYDR